MASSERAGPAASAGATAGAQTISPTGAQTGAAETRAGLGTEAGAEAGTGSSGPMAAATPIEAVRLSCLTNAAYHSSREAYLDTLHRWFMFGVIAFGAGAFVDVLPDKYQWLRAAFPAGAALLGALDLTFDLSNRARTHSMMKRRYFELLADLAEAQKSPEQVRVCLERFSADEEPPFKVLFLACWNSAQRTVFGQSALQFKIPPAALAFKNFLRRPGVDYGAPSPIKRSA